MPGSQKATRSKQLKAFNRCRPSSGICLAAAKLLASEGAEVIFRAEVEPPSIESPQRFRGLTSMPLRLTATVATRRLRASGPKWPSVGPGPVIHTSFYNWRDTIDLHLTTAFQKAKYQVQAMGARGDSVIFIFFIVALAVDLPVLAAYASADHANASDRVQKCGDASNAGMYSSLSSWVVSGHRRCAGRSAFGLKS